MKLFLISLFAISIHTHSFGQHATDRGHYGRAKILNSFCKVLNDLKKHYHVTDTIVRFAVNGEKPLGFFVYDLVDTLNNSSHGLVRFKEAHIYHFALVDEYLFVFEYLHSATWQTGFF